MDWLAFAAAVVTAVFAFFGTYISNRKQTVLVAYRIEQLEKKVNQHNNIIERLYKVEGQVAELQHDVSEVKGR